jgi:peroxiredoxin
MPARLASLLTIVTALAPCAFAAPVPDVPPPLPVTPESWVNTGPVSLANLKGKGVVLYFYEESCPSCRDRWKEVLAAAKQYEGKPVVFIAVNSGEPRGEVQSYVRDVHIPWPVIVDVDRSLEKAYGVGEISLNNIYQVRIVTADGRVQDSSYDIDKAGKQALEGASWTIDPAQVPDALKPAWFAVEFGDANQAAGMIKNNLRSPKADVKQAAEALKKVVDDRLVARLAEAKSAENAGRKWDAYMAYQSAAEEFRSFEMPADAQAARKALAADPFIKTVLVSKKSLDAARKLAANDKPASRKQAIAMLQKVVADVPDNSLASEAQKLIDQLEKP